jgi:hypothetical protein
MTFFEPPYLIIVSDEHAFKAHRLAQDTTWRPCLTDTMNPALTDFIDKVTREYVTITVYNVHNGVESGHLVAAGTPCPLCNGDQNIAYWRWQQDTNPDDQDGQGTWVLTHTPCPACRVAEYRRQHLTGRGQR